MRNQFFILPVLAGLGVSVFHVSGAVAATCWTNTCSGNYTLGTMCNSNFCKICQTQTMTNDDGVAVIYPKWVETTCSATNVLNCTCKSGVTQYECAAGYYGTATSASSTGCTKCPANATCAGGNESTYSCNSGYWATTETVKNGMLSVTTNVCKACPTNAICPGGSEKFQCMPGYYSGILRSTSGKSERVCTRCPAQDGVNGTTALGATKIKECFMPANKRFTDSTGAFIYTNDCAYSGATVIN